MISDDSKKNRIMEFSFRKFTSQGITHVTMDDISRGVGIGKGTLYKYFPSKEVLIIQTIEFISAGMEKKIAQVMEDVSLSPMEQLGGIIKILGERLSKMNPSVLSFLERSFPEAFERIQEVRHKIITNNLLKIFEEGKKTGHFNPDMDTKLTTHIVIGAINHLTQASVLSTLEYSLDNLLIAITQTILKGCLTQKGIEEFV